MSEYIEIQGFGMCELPDGTCVTADSVDREPVFYDLVVTRRYTEDDPRWGVVEFVDERENLSKADYLPALQELLAKYPNAEVCEDA